MPRLIRKWPKQINSSNPHPARRLDAILSRNISESRSTGVPILIQPEDWMQWDVPDVPDVPRAVPILIQPEDWMQFKQSQKLRSNHWLFQSSSSPKTGCNSGHFKHADINKLENNFRDPIIPHILREIYIIEKIAQTVMHQQIANLPGFWPLLSVRAKTSSQNGVRTRLLNIAEFVSI